MQLVHDIWQHRRSGVFWAGLLLRFLCMPFCTHSDLLSVYWRSQVFFEQGVRLVGLSPVQSLHDLFLWIETPLLPPANAIWPQGLDTTSHLTLSQIENWEAVIERPRIYRTLFLFKFPYLVFDLGCLAVLLAMLRDTPLKRGPALRYWWLNPVLILVTYVFSRFDVIVLFFVLLSLWSFRARRIAVSVLCLSAGTVLRSWPLFLLPFYVLSSVPISWKSAKLLVLGVLPLLLAEFPARFTLGYSPLEHMVNWARIPSFLLAARLDMASWDMLYLFPLLYLLLFFHAVSNVHRDYHNLQHYGLISLLLLFTTAASGQSPHYWSWFMPFLTLTAVQDRRIRRLSYLQFALLVVYSFVGGRSTAGYLFASISPSFFWSLPSPAEVIGEYVSIETFISLARTALSAVTLWMAYLALRQITTEIPLYPNEGPVR